MSVLHKIKAYLYENLFTKDTPTDYIARTSSEQSLNVKQVCQAAVSRGGADVSALAMEHAVELFLKEMSYQLSDGFSINTGYFKASARIKGVFQSPTDTFDPTVHSVFFRFQQGEKMRAEIPNIQVSILGVADAQAAILQVIDSSTGSINDVLTPEHNLKIKGHKIKVVGDHPEIGVSFLNLDTDESFDVAPNDIIVNNPSEVIIRTPALTAGAYNLRITTQYAGSVHLKEPRIALFEKELIVS